MTSRLPQLVIILTVVLVFSPLSPMFSKQLELYLDSNEEPKLTISTNDVELYSKEIEWKSVSLQSYSYTHTCGISVDDLAYCWGHNGNGQLGVPTVGSSDIPILVTGLPGNQGVANITLGGQFTCAILTDGNVSCWGAATSGQLGLNFTDLTADRDTPQDPLDFGGGRKAAQISAGGTSACALLDDGNVSCWGRNTYGVIGNSGSVDFIFKTPQQVSSFGSNKFAVKIGVGLYHACAILNDGSVSCWGEAKGLGNNLINGYRNYPVQTNTLGTGRTAIDLDLGYDYTCVVLDNGNVKCWGYNSHGQLGVGDTTNRYTPTSINALPNSSTAKEVFTGYGSSCARLQNDSLSCWGWNSAGQLGIGNNAWNSTPQQVIDLGYNRTIKSYDANFLWACAILDDNSMKCWSSNNAASSRIGVGQSNFQQTSIPGGYEMRTGWPKVYEIVEGISQEIFIQGESLDNRSFNSSSFSIELPNGLSVSFSNMTINGKPAYTPTQVWNVSIMIDNNTYSKNIEFEVLADSDLDSIPNRDDTNDDNDLYPDLVDACPLVSGNSTIDRA